MELEAKMLAKDKQGEREDKMFGCLFLNLDFRFTRIFFLGEIIE